MTTRFTAVSPTCIPGRFQTAGGHTATVLHKFSHNDRLVGYVEHTPGTSLAEQDPLVMYWDESGRVYSQQNPSRYDISGYLGPALSHLGDEPSVLQDTVSPADLDCFDPGWIGRTSTEWQTYTNVTKQQFLVSYILKLREDREKQHDRIKLLEAEMVPEPCVARERKQMVGELHDLCETIQKSRDLVNLLGEALNAGQASRPQGSGDDQS